MWEPKEYCACSGYRTVCNEYDTCDICGWSQSRAQDTNPDYAAAPNRISLREAQASFRKIGAKSELYLDLVRPPTAEDIRDPAWELLDSQ